MYLALVFVGIFAQPIKIEAIVLISEKAGLPVVAALDDMKRNVGQGKTGAAWHSGVE